MEGRRRARKLAKRLRFRRAVEIWGYQKRVAISEGARIGWEETERQGLLPADQKIIWRHPPAPHDPCPRCASLIGVAVGVRESFVGRAIKGGGPRYEGRELVRRRPPEHGHCDCYLELE